jgi:hypothetical protein
MLPVELVPHLDIGDRNPIPDLAAELNEPSGDFFGFFQNVSLQAPWVDL